MRKAVAAYLDWWREAGVGEAVTEAPANWFALNERLAAAAQVRQAPPVSPGPRQPPAPNAQPIVQPPRASVMDPAIRDRLATARTLEDLHTLLQGFEGCNLKATAKNLCFYRGAGQARLMLIGEAPGRDEDLAGKPFVGRAGQLLDRMLAAIGLDESSVHITNTVYWRPPGNRTPSPEETLACAPILARQMELVDPKVVLLLGGVAAKSVLGLSEGILRLRGRWRSVVIGGRDVKTLATLHPAYLLRAPAAKRQAWQDLLMVEKALTE